MASSEREESKVLGDVWLEEPRLAEVCLRQLLDTELHARAADYWEHGRGWKWVFVGSCLLNTSLLKLAAMSLDTSMGNNDSFGWLDPTGGSFSVRSTYELEVGKFEEGEREGWK